MTDSTFTALCLFALACAWLPPLAAWFRIGHRAPVLPHVPRVVAVDLGKRYERVTLPDGRWSVRLRGDGWIRKRPMGVSHRRERKAS